MIKHDCHTMEKFLIALLTHRDFPGDRQLFTFQGSATLILRKQNNYYLLATNHQAKKLDRAFAYLPLLQAIVPVSVIAQSQTSDIALLTLHSEHDLPVISPDLSNLSLDIDCGEAVTIYGFPNPTRPQTTDLKQLIEGIKPLVTQALMVGIAYDSINTDSKDYLKLKISETVKNGQSGGFTVNAQGQLLGINQGTRFGSGQGLISPIWEAIALIESHWDQHQQD